MMIINSDNLTNGVAAMLLTAPDGELLGIRVEWSIKSEYLSCQFTTLRVELNNNEVGKNISVNETFKDFSSADHLDCNRKYRPGVRAGAPEVSRTDRGATLSYVGKINSPTACV